MLLADKIWLSFKNKNFDWKFCQGSQTVEFHFHCNFTSLHTVKAWGHAEEIMDFIISFYI